MNLFLKLMAGFVGLVILGLITVWRAGFTIGVRLGQNVFADEMGGVNAYLWLVGLLLLIELLLVALLLFSSKARV